MNIQYENINFMLSNELSITDNLSSIKSLIRGKYFDKNNIVLNDNDINLENIIYEGVTPEEVSAITKDKNLSNSDYIYGKIYDTNPKINSNVITGDGLYLWVNRLSGEIFICTDPTPNKNIWIGQSGTQIYDDTINQIGEMFYIGMNSYSGSYLMDMIGKKVATTSNISYSTGLIDASVYFKSNSEVTLIDSANTNFTNDFVISYLIKPKSTNYYQTHFEKLYNCEFAVYQNDSGRIGVTFGNGNFIKNTIAQTSLSKNSWQHVKITKTGSIVTIEVNGINLPTISSYTGSFTADEVIKSSESVKIGHGSFGNFSGYMEEAILFAYGISTEESNNLTLKYADLI